MGKRKSPRSSARRLPTLSFISVVVVVAILVVGAITVTSRQRLTAEKNDASLASTVAATSHVQDLHVQGPGAPDGVQDPEKIANGLKQVINQSTEGLVEVQHADGSVSVDLDDRFQNVTVARVNSNGTLTQSCVDNPRAAGAFFGVDPKLIENAHTVTPSRKVKQ